MKRMLDDGSSADNSMSEDVTVDPVLRGCVNDWDAMEDLLHHILYSGLEWEVGNEGQILFTEPLCTPKVFAKLRSQASAFDPVWSCKAVREQLVQLLFETFNVSGFYASEQAVLSLYAVGRISGCTVDIGIGKIDIAAVLKGDVQHIASRRFDVGGSDLTKLLAQELGKSNPVVNLSISDAEKLKEQFACCAEDEVAYDRMLRTCETEEHTFPDGHLVRSVATVSSENQKQLLENTVLCGGTTSMTDFETRFQKEASLCSSAICPCLVKNICRRFSIVLGLGGRCNSR
ncbi:hypothetical protein V6N13_122750 [Hibiscus sabdariffa]